MQQYHAIKEQFVDALVFFQVGDFYELFYEDAKKAAQALGIALTARGKNAGEPIPLCGVPVHAKDHYVGRLVKSGFKVVICDQTEEAKPGKIVQRSVVAVLTPGTLTDQTLLDNKSASYLLSYMPNEQGWGILCAEIMTAQLFATQLPPANERALEAELIRFFPDEILVPAHSLSNVALQLSSKGYYVTSMPESVSYEKFQEWLVTQFDADTVGKLKRLQPVYQACDMMYRYLEQTKSPVLHHLQQITWYEPEQFLMLDSATVSNLELVRNNRNGTAEHTLFGLLDKASTAMGSRMIKKWIVRPLTNQAAISHRHDIVELLTHNIGIHERIIRELRKLADLERVVGRIAVGRAAVQDYRALTTSIELFPQIFNLIASYTQYPFISHICTQLNNFDQLRLLLTTTLNNDSALPWIIQKGYDTQLDRMRELSEHAHEKILQLEQAEQKNTGINSLKIRYNGAFGYSIEITKANLDSVPSYYVRQQTLVGRERFMVPELAKLQTEIVHAKAHAHAYEQELFDVLKRSVSGYVAQLRKVAHALAQLDALSALASCAFEYHYIRPVMTQDQIIDIQQGRHPIVERNVQHAFIPNDLHLDSAQSTLIITGPNMGGKSTFLRQTALICIMAHIGSFVPASRAHISILDRVFTRIGAGDSLAQGQSTFLVEMNETSAICNTATAHSFVILDEVGRGTSTYDGLAIAHAVAEYITTHVKARCLFATHYHELASLKSAITGVELYQAATTKVENKVIFLYQILPGVAPGSFGIEIAKLAQLPARIISRAQNILDNISSDSNISERVVDKISPSSHANAFISEKELEKVTQVKNYLNQLDYDNLSPRQAFDALWKLKELI